MSTTFIIAARELREKARIFAIAAGLAVMPFLAAALPTSRGHRAEMIPILAGFISIAVALGLAVVLGSTTVVTDLVQRRMSFYFSKPVPAYAVWFGKAGAAIVTSLVAFVIISLPASFLAGRSVRWDWFSDRAIFLGVVVSVVVLFLVSHTVASMTRSRSPLLGLDFALLLLSAGAVALIVRPLLFGTALETIGWLGVTLAAAVLLLMAVAPVWQLENGRTDIRRSHAALSRVFWPGVAVILILAGAFVTWFVSVTPGMLTHVYEAAQPASGGKVFVLGRPENRGDYLAGFLIDQHTGSSEKLGAMSWWGFRFSRDGSIAAWMAPAGLTSLRNLTVTELHIRPLRDGDATKADTATGMRFTRPSFVISDDGSRIAVASADGLVVIDAVTRKLLASTSALKNARGPMFFVNPGLLRIVETPSARRSEPQRMRIYELEVARRALTMTGERTLADPARLLSFSADGSRMLMRGSTDVLDGRTGAPIFGIEAAPAHRFGSAMLNDGSVAALTRASDGLHLTLFDPSGALRNDIALKGAQSGFVAAETDDDKLLVFTRSQPPGSEAGMGTLVVDRKRGVIERAMPGVRGPFPEWAPDPRLMRYSAGQWLVAGDAADGLVLWNPKTGERKTL